MILGIIDFNRFVEILSGPELFLFFILYEKGEGKGRKGKEREEKVMLKRMEMVVGKRM